MNRIDPKTLVPASSAEPRSQRLQGGDQESGQGKGQDFAALLGARRQAQNDAANPARAGNRHASSAAAATTERLARDPHAVSPRAAEAASHQQTAAEPARQGRPPDAGHASAQRQQHADASGRRSQASSQHQGHSAAHAAEQADTADRRQGAASRDDGNQTDGRQDAETAPDTASDTASDVPSDTPSDAHAVGADASAAASTNPDTNPATAEGNTDNTFGSWLLARLQPAAGAAAAEPGLADASAAPTLRPSGDAGALPSGLLLSAGESGGELGMAALSLSADAQAPTAANGGATDSAAFARLLDNSTALLANPGAASHTLAGTHTPSPAATPAASPLPTVLNTPLAADVDLPEALGERVLLLSQAGISSARIELHPAELGSLVVHIQVQNDQAQVAFTADNPATRSLLQQAMPQLREAMGTQGLQLLRTRVEERQREGGAGSGEPQRSREGSAPPRRISRIRLVDAYV